MTGLGPAIKPFEGGMPLKRTRSSIRFAAAEDRKLREFLEIFRVSALEETYFIIGRKEIPWIY